MMEGCNEQGLCLHSDESELAGSELRGAIEELGHIFVLPNEVVDL